MNYVTNTAIAAIETMEIHEEIVTDFPNKKKLYVSTHDRENIPVSVVNSTYQPLAYKIMLEEARRQGEISNVYLASDFTKISIEMKVSEVVLNGQLETLTARLNSGMDSLTANQGALNTFRQVCSNGMWGMMGISTFSFKHTKHSLTRVPEIAAMLEEANYGAAEYAEQRKLLASVSVDVQTVLLGLFQAGSVRMFNQVERMTELASSANRGNLGVSLDDALQGITDYFSNESPSKGFFGGSEKKKAAAFQKLVSMARHAELLEKTLTEGRKILSDLG